MRVSEAFPSKYLKAADLREKEVTVRISHIEMAQLDDGEHKPCVYFQGKERGLVLNKTNANNIALSYGDDTDGWVGKDVVLFPTYVDFQGRSVQAIRCRPAPNSATHSAPQPTPTTPMPDGRPVPDLDDEIPL